MLVAVWKLAFILIAATDVSVEWNEESGGQVLWHNDCDFETGNIIIDSKSAETVKQCGNICLNTSLCNHFSHLKVGKCVIKLRAQSTKVTKNRNASYCGYIPNRIWYPSSDDQHVLLRPNCSFPSSTPDQELSGNNESLSSCQKACRENYRCSAFTHDSNERKCVTNKPNGALPWIDVQFQTSNWSTCGIISSRIWQASKVADDQSGSKVLWQINCDFDGYQIGNMPSSNPETCGTFCFAYPRCTHFSYQHETCYVKNASALKDPSLVQGGICGYIPDRLQQQTMTNNEQTSLEVWIIVLIFFIVAAILVLLVSGIVAYYKYKVI